MFWIVGFDLKTGSIGILDDTDNEVEWLSKDRLNYILRNDYSIDIDYKVGSIPRQDSYVGITENGRTCLGIYKSNYLIFDFYKRRIVRLGSPMNMFFEHDFVCGFGINDIGNTHYLRNTWSNMLDRCYNFDSPDYPCYGARGAYVDKSFQRLSKFASWYEDQPNFKFRTEADLEIDKDLLNEKYYGVDSCILIPRSVNAKLGRLNRAKTKYLPRFCSPIDNRVRVGVNHIDISDKMKDTSYAPSFYENLVIDFMDSRDITEWKYATSMEDVGRKWVTAKKISFSSNKELCDQSLQKDWIIKDYYDRLLDTFDVKITDWGLYEDH